jgi:preprotein translocase subunit SecG
VHVLVCIFLILVVLIQQGKGADLSVFGGGATMAAFGARGATTLLHKLTVGAFITFILTTLAIAVLDGRSGGSSVMTGAPAPASAPATPSPAAPSQPPGQSPAPAEKPQGQ